MIPVHLVVPPGLDDPRRPSGGNTYDRQLRRALPGLGWPVQQHAVVDPRALGALLTELPDGAVVLLDGLVASDAPEALVPVAGRLRLVVLVHLPLAECTPALADREGAVLRAAAAVITTSGWTRRRLLDRHGLPPGRVHVATPGVDAAAIAPGTAVGGAFFTVGAVTPVKGYDVLLTALATLGEPGWSWLGVGALDVDPVFADRMVTRARALGPTDPERFTGRAEFASVRTGAALAATYTAADVLVVPSRLETYGMVVTEALARGLPVIATDVGGVSAALGQAPDGERPGLLVPPDDPAALARALRSWLRDAGLRRRLRAAAAGRRSTLTGWPQTAARVATVLGEVAAAPLPPDRVGVRR